MALTAKYPKHANDFTAQTALARPPRNWVRVFRVVRGSHLVCRSARAGLRVIQERNSGNTPTMSYTRGTDLSGSLEGAGGIGGLLGRSHGYSAGNWSTHNFYHADGNGNITYLVNSSQTVAASYRYDPYGNTISSSGSLASANVYRFSSKEFHSATGFYYYGYRWYAPNLQRWPNRDPLGETGFEVSRNGYSGSLDSGPSLYAFVRNGPVNQVDALGLRSVGPINTKPGGDFTPDGSVILDASCTRPIFSITNNDPNNNWKWTPLPSGEMRSSTDGIGWWGTDGRQHGFKIRNGNKCKIHCDSQGYPVGEPDCTKLFPFAPKCKPWQPGQAKPDGLPPVPGEGTWD